MEPSSALPPPTPSATTQPTFNNVSSPNDESAKRKRQPRNSACQQCASLKMKCVPSPVPGKCERCHRMNRDCVAAIPKPRKRRTESNVGLDTPTGAPISGILAGSTSSTPRDPSISTTQKPPPVSRSYSQDSLLARPDIRHNASQSFTALLARGLRLDSTYILSGDLLHGLDYNSVQNSLTVFRQLSKAFPFVRVNPAEDGVALATRRPFTTLAVCAVTSGSNPGSQKRWVQAVRIALSSKVIIEGEGSVDLMVGLSIYLAWHHHYLEKQQIYQYLCLLAGMAEDMDISEQNLNDQRQDFRSVVDRDRAFLGCYYLCSCLSRKALNKSNPMRWNDNLRRCAENIHRHETLPPDLNLVALTELAQAIDDLDTETQPEPLPKPPGYVSIVDMHARMAGNRLKSLKRQYPSLSSNVALSAAMIDIHQKRLEASPNNASVLIKCACDISEYIDDLLGRSPITLHQMSIVDWTTLLDILVLMAKVSKSLLTTGGWEAGAVSSMLSPETILDRLSTHIANAPQEDNLAPRNEGLVRWFQAFCSSVKRNLIHGPGVQQARMHPDSRFNAVNNGSGGAPNLPLPNSSEPIFRGSEFARVGVLDEGFLGRFMGQA